MVAGVLLVLTAHGAAAMHFFAEPATCAPSPQYGVPTSETDSRCEVLHDAFDVVDTSPGVDPGPTF